MFFSAMNSQFFDRKIPAMRVRFANIDEEGLFKPEEILINQSLKKFPDLATLVLLHEMNHAYVRLNGYNGIMNDGHDIIFHVGIDRLYKAGAYEGIL